MWKILRLAGKGGGSQWNGCLWEQLKVYCATILFQKGKEKNYMFAGKAWSHWNHLENVKEDQVRDNKI